MSEFPAAQGWPGHASWSVLDCAFGDGHHFIALWSAWREDPQRSRMLHYVAFATKDLPLRTQVATHARAIELQAGCKDLQPGFNRIVMEGGHLSLTLCVGDPAEMLDAQDFQADQIVVTDRQLAGDKWAIKALARCCRRGTQIATPASSARDLPPSWQAAGFRPVTVPSYSPGLHNIAEYDPAWTLKRTRHDNHGWKNGLGRCAVVGAGLSGAAVARVLALRGWDVTVLDRHPAPAGGASGLPVGLVVPHVSADDSPRSRLSRIGARITLQQAQAHLRIGEEWAPCGVTEMRLDPQTHERSPHWHATAGWMKPTSLVQAWLLTPGVTFKGEAKIARVVRDGNVWQLRDTAGDLVAQADVVVLANALGCRPLLEHLLLPDALAQKLLSLHAMYGTVTLGAVLSSEGFPDAPVNGMGSFVPSFPAGSGVHWAAGATYETDARALEDTAAQHRANFKRLQGLLPAVGHLLAPQFQDGGVRAWHGERCVTQDRLPWVGPVDVPQQPGLWICAGMGSRGLSFAALCAEFLAARLGNEPLPAESGLLRSLDINRAKSRVAIA